MPQKFSPFQRRQLGSQTFRQQATFDARVVNFHNGRWWIPAGRCVRLKPKTLPIRISHRGPQRHLRMAKNGVKKWKFPGNLKCNRERALLTDLSNPINARGSDATPARRCQLARCRVISQDNSVQKLIPEKGTFPTGDASNAVGVANFVFFVANFLEKKKLSFLQQTTPVLQNASSTFSVCFSFKTKKNLL